MYVRDKTSILLRFPCIGAGESEQSNHYHSTNKIKSRKRHEKKEDNISAQQRSESVVEEDSFGDGVRPLDMLLRHRIELVRSWKLVRYIYFDYSFRRGMIVTHKFCSILRHRVLGLH